MNITERITAMEAELAELKRLAAQPVQEESLLKKPVPGSQEDYWALQGRATARLSPIGWVAASDVEADYLHGSIFQSEKLAKAYAEAIETMLLLRHQPGTVKAKDDVGQYVIRLSEDNLYTDWWSDRACKTEGISPCFSTEEAAQRAIDTVGADRIMRMFKTFHHVDL